MATIEIVEDHVIFHNIEADRQRCNVVVEKKMCGPLEGSFVQKTLGWVRKNAVEAINGNDIENRVFSPWPNGKDVWVCRTLHNNGDISLVAGVGNRWNRTLPE